MLPFSTSPLALWLAGLSILAPVLVRSGERDAVRFARDVRPILSNKCFACHGPDARHRKAKLRLDRPNRAVVPGKPDASDLMQRVTNDDPRERMPPASSHKTLSAKEIGLLRQWIHGGGRYEAHWSLTVPRRAPEPTVRRRAWVRNFVDRWVLAALERNNVAPASAVDSTTLLRRVYFDLVGLPPTPEQVAAFRTSTDPDSFGKVVDRLLASKEHAERLASWWLDLVRYADTVGYHGDQEQHIAPYRDWVLHALHDNMRFDRFTELQLAGDLQDSPSESDLVATGYNRLLQTTHEGGAQAKEYLAIYAADRVRNFGAVWLGQTTGCARCHDHKFDPLTTKDFYALAAFFADIEEKGDFHGSPNTSPTTRPPELTLRDGSGRRTLITRARKPPRTVRVLARGNWLDDSGEIVAPRVPGYLPPLATHPRGRATRRDLARWLFQPDHPLTARVVVNRLWAMLFGKGLSARLEDLGSQGEWPVHGALLDALAVEFRESGWNLRHMIRLLVTSATYRQSARPRPELASQSSAARRLGRQRRWRLPAEAVRDTALAVSGLLVRQFGGRSVKPYQPAGYYRNLNFPKRTYRAEQGKQLWRRGVYVHWQRQFLHPMLRAFDAPTREECCAERPCSNTPQQALTLLNSRTFAKAAHALADRLIREREGDDARIRRGFELATSRAPTEREARVLRELLAKQDRADERAAWWPIARVLLNLAETYRRP